MAGRRSAPRIGLRLLLLAMLLCATFFGGWAANEWKHRAELERQRHEAERAAATGSAWSWTVPMAPGVIRYDFDDGSLQPVPSRGQHDGDE